MRKLIMWTIIVGILFSVTGCALHSEFSAGIGKEGTAHTAAMSGGRGIGMDFPYGAKEVQMENKTTSRAARD